MQVEIGRSIKERSHNLVFERSEGGEILGGGLWIYIRAKSLGFRRQARLIGGFIS